MIGGILVILISLVIVFGSIPFLFTSNAVEIVYSKLSTLDGTVNCIFCNTVFASSQSRSDHPLLSYDTLTLRNIDIRSVDINSKENVLYILGVEHKRQNNKIIDHNVIFLVDTNANKIADKITIDDKNLNLDNILFDDKDNKLYGTGTKGIENNGKLMRTNFIYEISLLGGKNKISFNNITTNFFPIESEDNDETGIIDMDIGTNSSRIYIILNNNSIIDGQNVISEEQNQVGVRPNKTIDNRQLYVIPYGNRIVNNPQEKVNYVLFNGIKSSDKDIVFGLNESTGENIKNYTLPGLNSRNLKMDSNKEILFVLGDYFAYNNEIKGLSKQSELITVIDTDNNNVSHFSLGNFTIKDFIYSPSNDVLYAITKGNMHSEQQKSNANSLLEINPKTGVIKDKASIPLELNYIDINDKSQTLFIIGKDSHDDENKILLVNVNNK